MDERRYFNDIFLYVDEHKLNQVIRNLLSNAMKFTPKGGIVRVKLALELHRQQPIQSSSIKLKSTTKSTAKPVADSMSSLSRRRTFELFSHMKISNSDNGLIPANWKTKQQKKSRRGSVLFPATVVVGARAIGTLKLSIVDSGPGVSEVSLLCMHTFLQTCNIIALDNRRTKLSCSKNMFKFPRVNFKKAKDQDLDYQYQSPLSRYMAEILVCIPMEREKDPHSL